MTEKLAPSKRHQYLHQGRVIYEWNQSLEEVNLYIEVPLGVSAKQLEVQVTATQLRIGLKGNPPYLDVSLLSACCAHLQGVSSSLNMCGAVDVFTQSQVK